jgi:hypothetical protein
MPASDLSFIDPSLPPGLAAAVREFHSWSQEQLLTDQASTTPTRPLYHYTDEAALRGILRAQRLWCFSHNQQTDPDEFNYSLCIAGRCIEDKVNHSRDANVRSLLTGLKGVIASFVWPERFDFYFFNFREHRDPCDNGTHTDGAELALQLGLRRPSSDRASRKLHQTRTKRLCRSGDLR